MPIILHPRRITRLLVAPDFILGAAIRFTVSPALGGKVRLLWMASLLTLPGGAAAGIVITINEAQSVNILWQGGFNITAADTDVRLNAGIGLDHSRMEDAVSGAAFLTFPLPDFEWTQPVDLVMGAFNYSFCRLAFEEILPA